MKVKQSNLSRHVMARSDFYVLSSLCYSMNLSRCKFEFSKDPRQIFNFGNAKRKSSALASSVWLNSIEEFMYSDIPDLFAEFFQNTFSSASSSVKL